MRPYSERAFIEIFDRLTKLEEQLQRISQSLPGLWQRDGGGQGGNGAWGYYSDPGATTIAAGASASLTVVEVKASGDTTVGSRTVVNKFPDATAANKRLIMVRCSDDAYLIVGQGCSTGGG